VQALLEGLNEEFNLRSQLIHTSPDLSTLDHTKASILDEGTRLSNKINVPSINVDITTESSATCPNFSREPSVSQFSYKTLNCIIYFFPNFCLCHEMESGKILGTWSERDWLYYLDFTLAPHAFQH
jgi:hypothetical protein